MQLRDKTVWITGASSGIGKALAQACAAQGARLILSARRIDALEQVRQTLPNSQQHWVIPLDLAMPELAAKTINDNLPALPPVDILINNAGISQRSRIADTQLDVYRQVMEVDYFGTVAVTQALLPMLIARKGMVVTIASVAGKVAGQGMSGYSAAKHAIVAFMDSLRAETATDGLQVLTVCPGFVQTDISRNSLTGDGSQFGELSSSIANGISAQDCATQIIRGIEHNKREIIIGKGLSRWAPLIKRLFPLWFMSLSARMAGRD